MAPIFPRRDMNTHSPLNFEPETFWKLHPSKLSCDSWRKERNCPLWHSMRNYFSQLSLTLSPKVLKCYDAICTSLEFISWFFKKWTVCDCAGHSTHVTLRELQSSPTTWAPGIECNTPGLARNTWPSGQPKTHFYICHLIFFVFLSNFVKTDNGVNQVINCQRQTIH